MIVLYHILQEFGLKELIDGKELSVNPSFDDSRPEYWRCITDDDSVVRVELQDEALVISVLTLFVRLRLARGIL